MVCPWPALSPQTAFTLSRLKEEEAAGANKLQINAISKESKEEKKIQALQKLKLLALPLAVQKIIVQLSQFSLDLSSDSGR